MQANQLKQTILDAAVKLSRTKGYRKVTRSEVAREAESGEGTINYHFDSMDGLRSAVMRHAVKNGVLEIVAQGLADRNPVVLKAPEELRRKAARGLV